MTSVGHGAAEDAVVLDGSSLTIQQLVEVAHGRRPVALAPQARLRMEGSRRVVEEVLASGDSVYGLTTGVGERKTVRLRADRRLGFSRQVVKGHLVAQGGLAPAEVVRAAMVCLANSYALGSSGVRPELAEVILDAANAGRLPAVRILGSVGEADLGPMADMADGLLRASGFALAEGEGLALISSNAFSTAWAALAVHDASELLAAAELAAALDLEAFAANLDALHPIVAEVRPHAGVRASLAELRRLLDGSPLFQAGAARNLQDPLTFRCVAQIHGAARDALGYAHEVVETELRSFQGNPLVVADEGRLISVGNFDVVAVATALDLARMALSPVVTSATERAVKLLQRPFSGLTAGLAEQGDTGQDALAQLGVAAMAIAAEARTLAQPVSFEVVSSSVADGIEDRMTMAPLAARRLAEMTDLTWRVLAVELTVAAQAVDLRPPPRLGLGTSRVHAFVRRFVPFTAGEDTVPADLTSLIEAIRKGALVASAR